MRTQKQVSEGKIPGRRGIACLQIENTLTRNLINELRSLTFTLINELRPFTFALYFRPGSDDEGFCVTIEAINNGNRWIQLKSLDLNFAYPFSDEPAKTLTSLGIEVPPEIELQEWEANTFVTFQHFFDDLVSTSSFVRQYMTCIGMVVHARSVY